MRASGRGWGRALRRASKPGRQRVAARLERNGWRRSRRGRGGRGARARREQNPEEEGRGTALRVHLSPPLVLRVESPMRRLTRAAVAVLIVADHSTTGRSGTPEPFGVPPRRDVRRSGRPSCAPPRPPGSARAPLQLLSRQPPTELLPRMLLGSFDERLAEALVQPGAAVLGGVSRRFPTVHAH